MINAMDSFAADYCGTEKQDPALNMQGSAERSINEREIKAEMDDIEKIRKQAKLLEERMKQKSESLSEREHDFQQKRAEYQEKDRTEFSRQFGEIQLLLSNANTQIRDLETLFSESNVKRIYDQLSDLYNLIHDTKTSTLKSADKTLNEDLYTAAYNLQDFQDFISEILSDYGIRTLKSDPGTPFRSKFQTPVMSDPNFNPNKATVEISIRPGFAWGEQVLQKEEVKLKGSL